MLSNVLYLHQKFQPSQSLCISKVACSKQSFLQMHWWAFLPMPFPQPYSDTPSFEKDIFIINTNLWYRQVYKASNIFPAALSIQQPFYNHRKPCSCLALSFQICQCPKESSCRIKLDRKHQLFEWYTSVLFFASSLEHLGSFSFLRF